MSGVVYWTGLGDEPKPTIQVMDFLIHRGMKQPWAVVMARAVVGQESDPKKQADMVWKFVKGCVKYVSDPEGLEWIQDPLITLTVAKKGDCDDQAVAAGALLGALGHAVTSMAVRWAHRAIPSHAVLKDLTAGVIVDPVTVPPDQWPPWKVGELLRV